VWGFLGGVGGKGGGKRWGGVGGEGGPLEKGDAKHAQEWDTKRNTEIRAPEFTGRRRPVMSCLKN